MRNFHLMSTQTNILLHLFLVLQKTCLFTQVSNCGNNFLSFSANFHTKNFLIHKSDRILQSLCATINYKIPAWRSLKKKGRLRGKDRKRLSVRKKWSDRDRSTKKTVYDRINRIKRKKVRERKRKKQEESRLIQVKKRAGKKEWR